jgi:hypothetical protein
MWIGFREKVMRRSGEIRCPLQLFKLYAENADRCGAASSEPTLISSESESGTFLRNIQYPLVRKLPDLTSGQRIVAAEPEAVIPARVEQNLPNDGYVGVM